MKHILIAEDDADNAGVLCEILTSAGYRVIWAETVEGVLAVLRRAHVDATILDLSVLRDEPFGRQFVPLIIFSARPLWEIEEAAERLGAAAILQKPGGMAALLETVARVVGGK